MIVLIFASIIFDVCYLLIKNNEDKHFTIDSYYWGQNDNVLGEQLHADPDVKYTFVINYYQNIDNSGAEMFELKLNYFTDYQLTNVYSLGMQIQNPSKLTLEETHTKEHPSLGHYNHYYDYSINYNGINVQYFNTDDGINYKAATTFNEKRVPYIIGIDDKPYAFDFEYITEILKESSLFATGYHYNRSSFDYFLYRIIDSTSNIVGGTGTYVNLEAEFEDVFRFFQYNASTGKFDILSEKEYSEHIVSFKVNYFERGAKVHEDSLFGQIGTNTNGGVIWGKY